MHNFDAKPPAACARIRAALEADRCDTGVAPELGGLIRALATSKVGGTFLCLGEDAGEVGAWILDGMDLSSGLVALARDPREHSALERELGQDLRVSVHRQDAESFLTDVRAHRFDLVVDRTGGDHRAVLRLGLGLLRPGGFYVVQHRARGTLDGIFACGPAESSARLPDLEPTEFSLAALGDGQGTLLITRRPPKQIRPTRRRG
jgi:predicted O-methyltransferase YrrM